MTRASELADALDPECSHKPNWVKVYEAAALLRQQEAVIRKMRGALVYHVEQTRPIERSALAIEAADAIVNSN